MIGSEGEAVSSPVSLRFAPPKGGTPTLRALYVTASDKMWVEVREGCRSPNSVPSPRILLVLHSSDLNLREKTDHVCDDIFEWQEPRHRRRSEEETTNFTNNTNRVHSM